MMALLEEELTRRLGETAGLRLVRHTSGATPKRLACTYRFTAMVLSIVQDLEPTKR